MASLLRKTRNLSNDPPIVNINPITQAPASKIQPKDSNAFKKEEILNNREKKTFDIQESDEEVSSLDMGYSPKKQLKKIEKFEKLAEYKQADYDRLKLYTQRIQQKTENLKEIQEKLPEKIDTFCEFQKLKLGCLNTLIEKMDEKTDDQTIKIEKLTLEGKVVENKILTLIKAKKEKYEIVSIIQRKKNIQDMIDRLDAQRFKSEMLKFSLEEFVSFGELCEDFEEFNQLCETFLNDHKIYLDKSDSVNINLSLLYDYVLDQIKEEEIYEEIPELTETQERNLIDQQYLNYLIMAKQISVFMEN